MVRHCPHSLCKVHVRGKIGVGSMPNRRTLSSQRNAQQSSAFVVNAIVFTVVQQSHIHIGTAYCILFIWSIAAVQCNVVQFWIRSTYCMLIAKCKQGN